MRKRENTADLNCLLRRTIGFLANCWNFSMPSLQYKAGCVRLSNLKRGEADAALFKVPAGYEVTGPSAAQRAVKIIKQAPSAPTPASRG